MLNSLYTFHRKVQFRWALLAAALVVWPIISGGPSVLAQDDAGVTFDYMFKSDAEGWTVDFADLPVDNDQSTFELDHGYRALPDGLEGGSIYVQGHNRSDDLFMFLKRQVGDLRPNATYTVYASVELATNVPPGTFGIGGSPGESVYVKAGASTVEPKAVEGSNRHLRMNVDKGNQSGGGESMLVLGNVANPEVSGTEYRIKTLDNRGIPLNVETDDEGGVWLIVGTDSGFEGLSVLYYARITYVLTIVGPPVESTIEPTATTPAEPTTEPATEPTATTPVEPTMEPTVEPTAELTVEPRATPTVEPIVEPTAVPRNDSASGLPVWTIVLIAGVVVALLCLALVTLRRRSKG